MPRNGSLGPVHPGGLTLADTYAQGYDPAVTSTDTISASFATKTARDLGFDEVLLHISRYAANVETQTLLLSTRPFTSRADAEREHTWVREALELLAQDNRLPIRRTNSLTSISQALRVGSTLSAAALLDCRTCLEQAHFLHQHTARHTDQCPTLARALVVPAVVSELVNTLCDTVDDTGQLLDDASSGLKAARAELTRAREAVRQEQAEVLRRYKAQLAGTYVAEREGRFVLPLRADAERINGTILGSSASGNTLYVEPQELIKHNNRLRLALARVQQEEESVLGERSALLQTHLSALDNAAYACVLSDRIAAIADWATRTRSFPVTFADAPVLRLRDMRHPLLLTSEAPNATAVVGNDLELTPGRALVLSGPNAGGKTVALKCLGLAVWLSKCGLPVPCDADSTIGWFDQVYTDIGDDQSIARSLSTFSSHVVHLAHCLSEARQGVLILLDEVAGGTDPDEGAALAEAILKALVAASASVAVTTHYPQLKQLAAHDETRFVNASVGFDLETMQPTFRVTFGIPGVSSALAVASRYGIPDPVIAAARQLLPQEHHDQQRLLQDISLELDKTAANRDASEALLNETQRDMARAQAEHEQALHTSRKALEQLRAELTSEVKQARADLLRAKTLLGLGTKDSYKQAEQLINQAALPITLDGSLTRALRTPTTPKVTRDESYEVGTSVYIEHLATEARVLEAPNKGQLRVSVGGLKMTVPISQVRPSTSRAVTAPARSPKRNRALSEFTPSDYTAVMRTPRNTCDLRGKRVDEGLSEVDGFIDQMLQLDEPAIFILHGHGTGAMRAAVREHLAGSPVVRHFEAASQEQGGDAFTVVWLR